MTSNKKVTRREYFKYKKEFLHSMSTVKFLDKDN
jgi:hypothetical protein